MNKLINIKDHLDINKTTFENLLDILKKDPYNFYIKSTDKLFIVNSSERSQKPFNNITGVIFSKDCEIVCYGLGTCIDFEDYINGKDVSNEEWYAEECIDGTMLKLYYYDNEWQLSTTRCINAQTSWWSCQKSFDTLFKETVCIDYNRLSKDYVYTFILQHPLNQLTLLVNTPKVVHVSTRSLIDLKEYNDVNVYICSSDGEESNNIVSKPNIIENGITKTITEWQNHLRENPRGNGVRGYILRKAKSDSSEDGSEGEDGSSELRLKMDSEIFKDMSKVRGNSQTLLIRYLQLINSDGERQKLRNYYPMYREQFDMIEANLISISNVIQTEYYHKYIKKEFNRNFNPRYNQTLKQLHGQYKRTKQTTTTEVVYAKLKTYNYKVLGFILGWW